MTGRNSKKSLIWVYPPNNWTSNYKQTFVYGWAKPETKLLVNVETGVKAGLKPASTASRIKIFSNGNFAQIIKLPNKKNKIDLIQIQNGKKKSIVRHIRVRNIGAQLTVPYDKFPRSKTKNIKINSNNTTIVIDPGHGGKEHGTHSPKGIPEKVYNLQIAKMLVETIHELSPPAKIYLTRSTDRFVSLKERVRFAKNKKCNILISIHHNALPDNENPLKHEGIGIYYTHDFVKSLAKSLLENISKESELKKYGIFKRDFALTRPDFCNAVLIECGFLIHPTESEYITQKETQKKIVRGIEKALSIFLQSKAT